MRTLFICQGNIMRSVVAESVLEDHARSRLGGKSHLLQVSSCGLGALQEQPPHPKAFLALEELGLRAVCGRSVPVEELHIDECCLAVTMTRQQCYQLASRFPEHARKCFSLIELNGALDTLLRDAGGSAGPEVLSSACGLPEAQLKECLKAAVDRLTGTPRESLRPMKGVPMEARELMTRFGPCFYQSSGIHDPLGGTDEEVFACARLIEDEVRTYLDQLLAFAASI